MWKAIKRVVGSVIFSIYMISITIVLAGGSSLLLFFMPRSFHDGIIRCWCRLILFGLRSFCGITYQVEGWENLPQGNQCIFVCKHQSAWDTMIFPLLFHNPAFVIKQELVRVPCYGWELNNGSTIAIDRNAGTSSLKKIIRASKEFLQNGQHLVIYPQGTRVPLQGTVEEYPYKPGFISIFESTKYPIVPVALNAGVFWHKKQFLKNAGVITIKFLPAIHYAVDLNKQTLLQEIIDTIEHNSNELVARAQQNFL